MRPAEQGFLLLTSRLGNPERQPLTVAQFRSLAERASLMNRPVDDRDLAVTDLMALGYRVDMAQRIVSLLSDERLLVYYLGQGNHAGCVPVTRISAEYPGKVWEKLGNEAPGCLWLKGDPSLLNMPKISLVGSREIRRDNAAFAAEVGKQAARQGYALVSGNARGADRIAQQACLQNGGKVICIVADSLLDKKPESGILYISEDDYDAQFSAQRAHSRNRLIHALGEKTFVAQTDLGQGGTWAGTTKNLQKHWSQVFCFDDGSKAVSELIQMDAEKINMDDLQDISALRTNTLSLFMYQK